VPCQANGRFACAATANLRGFTVLENSHGRPARKHISEKKPKWPAVISTLAYALGRELLFHQDDWIRWIGGNGKRKTRLWNEAGNGCLMENLGASLAIFIFQQQHHSNIARPLQKFRQTTSTAREVLLSLIKVRGRCYLGVKNIACDAKPFATFDQIRPLRPCTSAQMKSIHDAFLSLLHVSRLFRLTL